MTVSQFNELRKKHNEALAAMKEAAAAMNGADEARKAELEQKFNKAEADQEGAYQELRRAEKLIEAERRAAENFAEREEFEGKSSDKRDAKEIAEAEARAFYKMISGGVGSLTTEERQLLRPEKRGTNVQVVGTDSLGGYLVPTTLSTRLFEAMKAYGGVLQVANTISTDGGGPLNFPTLDDTGAAAVLVAESGASTVQDMTFGQKTLNAYMYRDLMKVSYELLQDSAIDIEALITRNMGVRFGRAANTSLTTGSGSSQPNGVVTASTLGKTAASATAITFAEILDLVNSVDPAYRGNARFMFHDNTLTALKKLSIGSGDARPLWQPSFAVGEPATIDGYQYTINQDMDSSINAASKLILFGDFSYYLVRQVRNLSILRNDALYMANGQIGLFGFARWDGELMNTSAVKHLITAAS